MKLSKKIEEEIIVHYNLNKNQSEISKILKISRSAIVRAYKILGLEGRKYKVKKDIEKKIINDFFSMSQLSLGKKYKLSKPTILEILKRNNIKNKYFKYQDIDKKLVIKLYCEERKTVEEIAFLFGVSIHPINTILRRANKKRTHGETLFGKFSREKNPNWKGGITKLYLLKRNTMQMREWKKNVLKRDGFKCVECGDTKKLHCHHIVPFRDCIKSNENEITNINNGITLCLSCHRKTIWNEYELVDFYRSLLNCQSDSGNRVNSGKTLKLRQS